VVDKESRHNQLKMIENFWREDEKNEMRCELEYLDENLTMQSTSAVVKAVLRFGQGKKRGG